VIGADGAVGGFTVMNDWSARDLQRKEMRVGLGRRRERTSRPRSGPVVVTPGRTRRLRLEMVARRERRERSRGNLGDMYHSWGRSSWHAARNTHLRPGDVVGSGTVGTAASSSTATSAGSSPATRSSSRSDRLGVLRNRIAASLIRHRV
jgi:fumarylacetoacetate (FAA) hydrolase